MKESSSSKKLAEKLIENVDFKRIESASKSLLLFPENYISIRFIERFNIESDRDKFEKAFQITTTGVGNEATKINSVISSSLLPLLVFYRLFENTDPQRHLIIKLDGNDYVFTKAFFEVRNKVVGYPSCIDVVLQATDGSLLFLESKFTEYLDSKSNKKTFGSSYYPLYDKIRGSLSKGEIEVSKDSLGSLILESADELYIEGIKQSISHLIGLARGPQDVTDGPYDNEYLQDYKKAFNKAPKLFYGTILFNPTTILPEAEQAFIDYCELFEKTIGTDSNIILKEIETWCKKGDVSKVNVLKQPLTYQTLLLENSKYKDDLPSKIVQFYQF